MEASALYVQKSLWIERLWAKWQANILELAQSKPTWKLHEEVHQNQK